MIQRHKPLARSTKPLKRSPLRKVSKAHAKELRVYSVLAKRFKERHEHCEARLEGCTVRTTDVHHVLGRGKYLLVESTWLAVCRHCHEAIHQNPNFARTVNLLK